MLTRDEQRAARSARRLAADALTCDRFPECHIGGGSSWAVGWPKGHRTDWDRKGFRVEVYDLEARKPVTVAEVKWPVIRRHGLTIPATCAALTVAMAADRTAHHEYERTRKRVTQGDPGAPPHAPRIIGPIDQPAQDAAWGALLEASDKARQQIDALLDEAFPLALGEPEPAEPSDLLELLEAMA